MFGKNGGELLRRVDERVRQWDEHATTCKQCEMWFETGRGKPCDVGLASIHDLMRLLG